jgi:hypothetical protein
MVSLAYRHQQLLATWIAAKDTQIAVHKDRWQGVVFVRYEERPHKIIACKYPGFL